LVHWYNVVYEATQTVIAVQPDTNWLCWKNLCALEEQQRAYDPGVVERQLAVNDLVVKVADAGSYYKVRVYGTSVYGFVDKTAVTEQTERVQDTIPAQTIVDQLFRIYEVGADDETNTVTVRARHISYDFKGNSTLDCVITNASPQEAIAALQTALVDEDLRTVATNVTGKTVTADWSFKNPVNALLDPDIGLMGKLGARLVRNNENFYLLSGNGRSGITIAYGVNMLGVNWTRNIENVVTRVIPRSGTSDKGYLYISNGGKINGSTAPDQGKMYIESANSGDYQRTRYMILNCNYSVGQEYEKADGTKAKYTEADVLAKMREDAISVFIKDHADGADIELDVEFLLLGDTEEYKQYKGLQTVCLYDVVTVKTGKSGIDAEAVVTEYEYDCLRKRYNSIKLGTINSFKKRLPSYRMIDGSITYEKLSVDLINRIRTGDAVSSTNSDSSSGSATGGAIAVFTPNSKDDDGIVLKGSGNANKVWKTDSQGNPAWRDEQTVTGFIPTSEKGAANGVATLDSGGKVPASELPSYVDDVLEYASKSNFPATGEAGKIYVAKDTGKTYRWSGSAYVELSSYDEATQSASGLMSASDKAKLDGIEAQANKYVLPQASSSALGGIKTGWTGSGKDYPVELDSNGKAHVQVPWTDNNTTYAAGTGISISGTNNAIAVQTGYTQSGKNYPVQAGTGGLYVNVPWENTVYTLPLAANGTRGGVQTGFTKSGNDYPVALSSEKMYVNVSDKLPMYLVTSCDANTVSGDGMWIVKGTTTNAPVTKHGSLINVATVGTPCQMFLPDNELYIYKRYYTNSAWSAWTKMYAGYADSAGSAGSAGSVAWDNVTGKPSSYYTLPLAANGTRGGVQIGYTETGKKYAVKLDSEKMYVEVPWTADGGNAATVNGKTVGANVPADAVFTDHQYSAGTGLSLSSGAFSVKLGYTTANKKYKVQADTNGNLYVDVPWTDTPYSLPLAATGTRGGVQVGFTTDANNRNYAVQLSSEKMYVNVPWTDTKNVLEAVTTGLLDSADTAYSSYAEDGKLKFVRTATGATNNPTSTGNWQILETGDANYGFQLAMQTDSDNVYFRRKYTGTWRSWVNLTQDTVYTLPLAASGTRGGVQIGYTTDGANRNYAVQLSSEKMYVNVPWTDESGNNKVAKAGDTMTGALNVKNTIFANYFGSSPDISERLTSIDFSIASGAAGRQVARLDMAASAQASNMPPNPTHNNSGNSAGSIWTFGWDTTNAVGTQLYIPNGDHVGTSYGRQMMYLRGKDSGAWTSWFGIPYSDGTGASGTWGIDITGNATTATTSQYLSTPQAAGYTSDAYGNFKHASNNTTNYWALANYAGAYKFKYYWETGNITTDGNISAASFTGQLIGTADKAVAPYMETLTIAAGSTGTWSFPANSVHYLIHASNAGCFKVDVYAKGNDLWWTIDSQNQLLGLSNSGRTLTITNGSAYSITIRIGTYYSS